MIKEKILCAAIWFNDGNYYPHQPVNIDSGFIVTGLRHCNCYSTLSSIGRTLGIEGIAKNAFERIDRDNQGFLTSSNRYVDRKEGFKIAKENNQIFHKMHDGVIDGILCSEDLY